MPRHLIETDLPVLFAPRYGLSQTATAAQNDAAFAAMIAEAVSQARTDDTIGVPAIWIPAGRYAVTSLVFPPWVKLVALGSVELDFSSMSATGAAIRVSNETAPATMSAGKNAANMGPFLNGEQGVFYLRGPGIATSARALDLGNASDLAEPFDFRDACVDNVVMSHFGVGLFLRRFDSYLLSFRRLRMESVEVKIKTDGPSQTNSGERLNFFDCTFAGGAAGSAVGVYHDCDALDMNFFGCSFDFCRQSVVYATANSRYCKLSFLGCHFENSNDDAIIRRVGGAVDRFAVDVRSCKVVPRTSTSTVPTGARTDGRSTPFSPLFKGAMNLTVDGLYIGGFEYPYGLANAGLFLCDSDVRLKSYQGVTFNDWNHVVSARSQVLNYNSNFDHCTAAADLAVTAQPGWRSAISTASTPHATCIVDTANAFAPSGKSLKITASNATNFFALLSDPIRCSAGDQLTSMTVLYGDVSTGDLTVEWRIRTYRDAPAKPLPVSSITQASGKATVTTTRAHGLSAGQIVEVFGAAEDEYNGAHFITVDSATTFSYKVATGAASPATGTIQALTEPLEPVGMTALVGDDFADIYANTDDPSYTGDRLWWARQKTVASYPVPAGVTAARLEVVVSKLGNGESVWLGEAIIARA